MLLLTLGGKTVSDSGWYTTGKTSYCLRSCLLQGCRHLPHHKSLASDVSLHLVWASLGSMFNVCDHLHVSYSSSRLDFPVL